MQPASRRRPAPLTSPPDRRRRLPSPAACPAQVPPLDGLADVTSVFAVEASEDDATMTWTLEVTGGQCLAPPLCMCMRPARACITACSPLAPTGAPLPRRRHHMPACAAIQQTAAHLPSTHTPQTLCYQPTRLLTPTCPPPHAGITNLTMAHIHLGNSTTNGPPVVILLPVGEAAGVSIDST